jgi:adenine/guanine phosphoribosyltransferase-like PRPP-binding protein
MMQNDESDLIVSGDHLATLQNCEGYYECPRGSNGEFLGPLVGYAGKYSLSDGSQKNFVGEAYLNFSMADQWPAVLGFFAEELADRIYEHSMSFPAVILGAPMAGIKLSTMLAEILGCRHIFAEKEVIEVAKDGQREKSRLILSRYEIYPGDRVLIGEELVNNFSTTAELCALVESAGGSVIGISCAINRSASQVFWMPPDRDPLPIVGVIEKSMPQYRQDDPVVAAEVAKGNIIWKPKKDWARLKATMEQYPMF